MKKKQLLISVTEVPTDKFLTLKVKNICLGIISLNGEISCFLNKCPHAGAPICNGKVTSLVVGDNRGERKTTDTKVLKCPWHGWEFKLPDGKSFIEGLGKLVKFKTEIIEGNVYIYL